MYALFTPCVPPTAAHRSSRVLEGTCCGTSSTSCVTAWHGISHPLASSNASPLSQLLCSCTHSGRSFLPASRPTYVPATPVAVPRKAEQLLRCFSYTGDGSNHPHLVQYTSFGFRDAMDVPPVSHGSVPPHRASPGALPGSKTTADSLEGLKKEEGKEAGDAKNKKKTKKPREDDNIPEHLTSILRPFLRRADYLEVQYTSMLSDLCNMAYEVESIDHARVLENHNLSIGIGGEGGAARANIGTSAGSKARAQAQVPPPKPRNDSLEGPRPQGDSLAVPAPTNIVLVGLDANHQNPNALMAFFLSISELDPATTFKVLTHLAETGPVIPMPLPAEYANHPEQYGEAIHCPVVSLPLLSDLDDEGGSDMNGHSATSALKTLLLNTLEMLEEEEGAASNQPPALDELTFSARARARLGSKISATSSATSSAASPATFSSSSDVAEDVEVAEAVADASLADQGVEGPTRPDRSPASHSAAHSATNPTSHSTTHVAHSAMHVADDAVSTSSPQAAALACNTTPLTDWFVADDNVTNTRYFCIKGSTSLAHWQINMKFEPFIFDALIGSTSLAHWQINMKFEPVIFESPSLGVRIHSGVYGAALKLYDDLVPLVRQHMASSPNASLSFTGHSLGGSLASVIVLLLVYRGDVPVSAFSPCYTFGAPAVFCGGGGGYESPQDPKVAHTHGKAGQLSCLGFTDDHLVAHTPGKAGLLSRLGFTDDHLVNVIMHKDICPRIFVCDYTTMAGLLKKWMPAFKDHLNLQDKHQHKLLYNFIGRMALLRPDDEAPFIVNDADHSMLPSTPGMYKMYEPDTSWPRPPNNAFPPHSTSLDDVDYPAGCRGALPNVEIDGLSNSFTLPLQCRTVLQKRTAGVQAVPSWWSDANSGQGTTATTGQGTHRAPNAKVQGTSTTTATKDPQAPHLWPSGFNFQVPQPRQLHHRPYTSCGAQVSRATEPSAQVGKQRVMSQLSTASSALGGRAQVSRATEPSAHVGKQWVMSQLSTAKSGLPAQHWVVTKRANKG
eukprot:gene8112-1358_t